MGKFKVYFRFFSCYQFENLNNKYVNHKTYLLINLSIRVNKNNSLLFDFDH